MTLYKSFNTYADEIEHERKMKSLGKQRINKRRLSHVEREEESVTSYGKVMVSNTIRPMAQEIQTYLESNEVSKGQPEKAFTKLKLVEPEISALITAKHIINCISQHKPLTATSISSGTVMISLDNGTTSIIELKEGECFASKIASGAQPYVTISGTATVEYMTGT